MKGKGRGGFGGGMQQLMKQANQMQNKMKKVQEDLAERTFEGGSGGGAVQITVSGDSKVTGVQIDEEVIKSDDKEMLEDMILSATNEALKKAKETSDSEMSKVTGGMGLPGMF